MAEGAVQAGVRMLAAALHASTSNHWQQHLGPGAAGHGHPLGDVSSQQSISHVLRVAVIPALICVAILTAAAAACGLCGQSSTREEGATSANANRAQQQGSATRPGVDAPQGQLMQREAAPEAVQLTIQQGTQPVVPQPTQQGSTTSSTQGAVPAHGQSAAPADIEALDVVKPTPSGSSGTGYLMAPSTSRPSSMIEEVGRERGSPTPLDTFSPSEAAVAVTMTTLVKPGQTWSESSNVASPSSARQRQQHSAGSPSTTSAGSLTFKPLRPQQPDMVATQELLAENLEAGVSGKSDHDSHTSVKQQGPGSATRAPPLADVPAQSASHGGLRSSTQGAGTGSTGGSAGVAGVTAPLMHVHGHGGHAPPAHSMSHLLQALGSSEAHTPSGPTPAHSVTTSRDYEAILMAARASGTGTGIGTGTVPSGYRMESGSTGTTGLFSGVGGGGAGVPSYVVKSASVASNNMVAAITPDGSLHGSMGGRGHAFLQMHPHQQQTLEAINEPDSEPMSATTLASTAPTSTQAPPAGSVDLTTSAASSAAAPSGRDHSFVAGNTAAAAAGLTAAGATAPAKSGVDAAAPTETPPSPPTGHPPLSPSASAGRVSRAPSISVTEIEPVEEPQRPSSNTTGGAGGTTEGPGGAKIMTASSFMDSLLKGAVSHSSVGSGHTRGSPALSTVASRNLGHASSKGHPVSASALQQQPSGTAVHGPGSNLSAKPTASEKQDLRTGISANASRWAIGSASGGLSGSAIGSAVAANSQESAQAPIANKPSVDPPPSSDTSTQPPSGDSAIAAAAAATAAADVSSQQHQGGQQALSAPGVPAGDSSSSSGVASGKDDPVTLAHCSQSLKSHLSKGSSQGSPAPAPTGEPQSPPPPQPYMVAKGSGSGGPDLRSQIAMHPNPPPPPGRPGSSGIGSNNDNSGSGLLVSGVRSALMGTIAQGSEKSSGAGNALLLSSLNKSGAQDSPRRMASEAAELELLQLLQPMASIGSGSGNLQAGNSSVLRMASRSSIAVQQQHVQQQAAGQLQLRASLTNQGSQSSPGQGEGGSGGATPSVLSGLRPHMQPVIPPLDPAALQGKPSLGAGVGSPLAPLKVGGSGGEAGQLQAAAGVYQSAPGVSSTGNHTNSTNNTLSTITSSGWGSPRLGRVGELPRNFGVDFELALGRDVAVLGGPEGFLGSGASGMVYKGTYKGMPVAVKLLAQRGAAMDTFTGSGAADSSRSAVDSSGTAGAGIATGTAQGEGTTGPGVSGTGNATEAGTTSGSNTAPGGTTTSTQGAGVVAGAAALSELASQLRAAVSSEGTGSRDASTVGTGASYSTPSPEMGAEMEGMVHELEIMGRLSHPNVVRVYGGCLKMPCMFIVQELMSGTLSTLIHRGIGLQAYVHPRATSNTASTAIPQSNPWVGSGSTHPGTGGTWPETIPDTIPESGPHADDPGHHPEGGSAGQRSTTTTPAMSGGTTVTLAPDGGSVTTPAPANRSEAQLFLSNSPFGGAATGAPASVAASGSAGGSSNGRAESPRAAAAAAAAAGSGGVGVSAGAGGNPEGRPSRPRKSLDDAGSSSEFTKGGTSSSSRGMASSVAGGAGTTGAGANFAAAAAAAYDNAYASMLHSGTLSAFSLPITASEGPNRSSMPGGGGSAALPSAAGSEAYAYSTTTGTLSVSTTTHISRLPPLASLPEGGENSVTPQDGLNGGVTIGSVIPEEVSADLPPGSLIRPGTMGWESRAGNSMRPATAGWEDRPDTGRPTTAGWESRPDTGQWVEAVNAAAGAPVVTTGPPPLLPLQVIIRIAADVAAGLAYLHSLDIVHRDLKPGNILLTSKGRAKIGDFGLARVKYKTYLSTRQMDAGTISYMAPESFDVKVGGMTTKCDIFSLGVIIWEMLTGRRPWAGLKHVAIIYQVAVLNMRLPLPEDSARCPPALTSLVTACWSADPHGRPSAQQVYKSLVTLATELGITLPSPDEDDDDVAHDDAADGVTQVRQGLSWQEAQLSNPPRTGSSATTATTYNASTSTGHSSSVALYTPAQQ